MFVKRIILYTITEVSAILLITYFFSGFKINQTDAGYFVGLALFIASINYFIDPIIKFFALKIKFITVWLFNFIALVPLLYIIKLIVSGIYIGNGNFRSMNLGVFQIIPFEMDYILTIILSALIMSFASAVIRWLLD
ncbi:MAG: phage holin family protein [bacterium]